MSKMSVQAKPFGGSDMWSFFTPISNTGYATCKICKKKLSYKTTTSNLKKHLSAVHSTISLAWKQRTHQPQPSQLIINPNESDIPQPGPSNIVSPPASALQDSPGQAANLLTSNQLEITTFSQKKMSTINRKNIDKKLLALFIKDLQPFRIVEDIGFKEFIKALNPNYEFPDGKFISHVLIPSVFEECKNNCKQKLKNASTVCLTTDTWTSRNIETFIAITAHFINNFKLESLLLDCIQITEPHTSANISENLKTICEEWEILEKINFAVTDNAKKIKNAITNYFECEYISCFAHNLNLIVKTSLNNNTINCIIDNVRTIVKYFKKSNTAAEKLRNYQMITGSNSKKLIQDVPTRWKSTYQMIDRFILLKEPIKATIAILNNKNLPNILNTEWEILHEIAVILKPIESATHVISGEKYPTSSIIIPIISGMKNIYAKLKQKDFSADAQQIIHSIEDGIENRFQNIENHTIIQICTFLDLRFKNAFFFTKQLQKLKAEIISMLVENRNSSINPNVQYKIENGKSNEELSIYDALDESVEKYNPEEENEENKVLIEIEDYLKEKFYIKTGDPLIWWKDHQFQFPLLKQLVEKLFNIAATSVPCERVFSKAELVLNEKRNGLKAEKLSMLLFLHHNS